MRLTLVLPFLLVMILPGIAVATENIDVQLDRYRDAESLGKVATVSGLAFEERRKPKADDLPVRGISVILLPHSDALLSRLEAIKQSARMSMDRYREAAPAIQKARAAFEKALWEAGAGDIAPAAITGADGTFRIENVPAGEWILVATRSIYMSTAGSSAHASTPNASDQHFLPYLRLVGYYAMTFWVRELTLGAGDTQTLELTDRNPWFTGVTEDRQMPAPPRTPTQPGSGRGVPNRR